jgi:hypothetical protein
VTDLRGKLIQSRINMPPIKASKLEVILVWNRRFVESTVVWVLELCLIDPQVMNTVL